MVRLLLDIVIQLIHQLALIVSRIIRSILSYIGKIIKRLFTAWKRRRVNKSIQNALISFNGAMTFNRNLKDEAIRVCNSLPNVPEKRRVEELIKCCSAVEEKIQKFIDNNNNFLIEGTNASNIKFINRNALNFVSTIKYPMSFESLHELTDRNYFIESLLEYSQVENVNYYKNVWTYRAHGISFRMWIYDDCIVVIEAKKDNPIRYNPDPRDLQPVSSYPSQLLHFDNKNELVFSIEKRMDTIDHYDVFEYFDYVSHLLDNLQINPSAKKTMPLTRMDADTIEYEVASHIKELEKIAPPPPDYVPDNLKIHGGKMRWANYFDVNKCGMLSPRGFMLGKMGYGAYLYSGDYEGHILTIAATRSGKGIGVVIPNLLIHKGSAVILDPKGENFCVTANARIKLGNKVYYYDPWGLISALENSNNVKISNEAIKARINPLDCIGQDDIDMLDKASMFASSLVVRSDKDPFFPNEAEMFLARLITYVCAKYPKGHRERNLIKVRELLQFNLLRLKTEVLNDAEIPMTSKAVEELVNWIDRNIRENSRSLNNIIDVAQQATNFLSSRLVADSLTESTFDISQLKVGHISLFLVIETERNIFNEKLYKPLIRLLVTTCFHTANIHKIPQYPLLFMLDEVAQLGTLQYLPQLLAIYAGKGVVVWTIWQNYSQITSLYGDDANTIIGNCSIQQYFGVNDNETAKYVSTMAGKTTIYKETTIETEGENNNITDTTGIGSSYSHGSNTTRGTNRGYSYQGFNFSSAVGGNNAYGENESYNNSYSFSKSISKGNSFTKGINLTRETTDLITPEEVRKTENEKMSIQIVFYNKKCEYPILCGKIAYYKDKEFYGLFDENYTRF